MHRDWPMPSSNDTEVRKLKKIAKSIPEVRQDKVKSIKKQMKSGAYRVPAEAVARSIANLCNALTSDKAAKPRR